MLEVGDDQGVNDFNVFIVECLQVVVHHRDVLSQRLNLFFVLTEDLGRALQIVLYLLDMQLHVALGITS